MSAADIRQGIINNLSAVSAIGSCQIATNFKILETTSACCAVVFFSGFESAPWAMNNEWERTYTHQIRLYVKDLSTNSMILEDQMEELIDISVCSLESDRTLQGNPDIRELKTLSATHDVETIVTAGGAAWYSTELSIGTVEWPSN